MNKPTKITALAILLTASGLLAACSDSDEAPAPQAPAAPAATSPALPDTQGSTTEPPAVAPAAPDAQSDGAAGEVTDETAEDKAKKALEQAKEDTAELGDEVAEKADELADKAGELAEDARKSVAEGAAKADQAIQDTVNGSNKE